MRIIRQLDEDVWREFVDHHPRSNIFHTPEMFEVFARAEGHRPTLWATVDSDGNPLALFTPVQITLMDGFLRQFTTRAVAYGSVLCAPSPEGEQGLKMLLQAYKQETRSSILFTELRNLSDLDDIQPTLNKCDFAHEGHLNFLIDLRQPEKTVWQGISKSGRQSVRTSRNKGTVIEETSDRQEMALAYALLKEVYARAQVPLANFTLFEAAFDILKPRGMFKVLFARAGKDCIGTCFLLIYKQRVIDWYAGSDRNFSAYYPSELLIWHTLQWGIEHDHHLFDFGGAGKPDEDYGPRKFKAKFGGKLVNYGRNTCVHAPVRLRVSEQGYRLMKRFV
jgi:serine/alanine adding enzyme